MKRLFSSILLVFLVLVPALADIWPVADDIGQITEGRSAVYRQEFRLLHEDRLSAILPMDSFIVSEDGDEIRIKDSTGAVLITVFTDESSLIEAISFQARP